MIRWRAWRSPPAGGFAFPIDPKTCVRDCKALWQADSHPLTLIVCGVDLNGAKITHDHKSKRTRQILMEDRQGDHRIVWINKRSTRAEIIMPFNRQLPVQAHSSIRFWRCLAGKKSGPFPPPYRLTYQQKMRLSSALRLLDAVQAGASRRKITEHFCKTYMTNRSWSDSAERAQLRRRLKQGQSFVDGGYRILLNPFV